MHQSEDHCVPLQRLHLLGDYLVDARASQSKLDDQEKEDNHDGECNQYKKHRAILVKEAGKRWYFGQNHLLDCRVLVRTEVDHHRELLEGELRRGRQTDGPQLLVMDDQLHHPDR